MELRRFPAPLSRLLLLLVITAIPAIHAETLTLTDKQGRSIQADVISVDGDKAKIRRSDRQTFELPLSTLSDADQQKLRDWAASAPAKSLPAGAVQLELSRGVFQTSKQDSDVTLTTGDIVKNGRTTTEEKWGYSVTLVNKTTQPLDNLRAEYRLFATKDNVHVKEKEGLKKKAYSSAIEPIPTLGRAVFRTETISAFKMKYNGNIQSAKTGDTSSREILHGVWFRLYRGDQLVQEIAMPSSLMTTETW
jgi:hypothetical protein